MRLIDCHGRLQLRGLWQHGPYFHDGSATTLEDVGRIYNTKRSLG